MGFFAVLFFILPEVDIFVSIGFLAWAVLFHAGALFFKHRYFGKIRRLVINGSVKTIIVLDNWINWSTQVNNTPQRRISFELDGVESNCKTYSHRMADEFSGTIPVLIHPRLKFVIPLGFLIHYAIEEKKP